MAVSLGKLALEDKSDIVVVDKLDKAEKHKLVDLISRPEFQVSKVLFLFLMPRVPFSFANSIAEKPFDIKGLVSNFVLPLPIFSRLLP